MSESTAVSGGMAVPCARRGSFLGDTELAALAGLVTSNASLSAGIWRERFEERFRRHLGVRHALTTTSGTVALELAVRVLDLRPGDEVVVTPQTFQATAQPLLGQPADVVFCDVDPGTLNMSPVALEAVLTERTRAILLVHYGGRPADMTTICTLARERGIVVIEDCAHALGAETGGRRPGSLGDIGCFSFHSSKNLTTLGEGGMITLERDDWAARIDRMRNNECDAVLRPVPGYSGDEPTLLPWMKFATSAYGQQCLDVRGPGTNATLSEAACAVGLAQMDRLNDLVTGRRAIAARLDAVLAGRPGIELVPAGPDDLHAQHLYTFFAGGAARREALVRELHARGVEIALRYFPLHLLPEWRARGHGPGECPEAERRWFQDHVNLPCHPGLSPAQVDHLVEALAVALDALHARSRGRPTARIAPALPTGTRS